MKAEQGLTALRAHLFLPSTCSVLRPPSASRGSRHEESPGLPLLLSHPSPQTDTTHCAKHLGLPCMRCPQAWLLHQNLGLPRGGHLPPAQGDSGVGFRPPECPCPMGTGSRLARHYTMPGHSPLPLASASINRDRDSGLIAVPAHTHKKILRAANSYFPLDCHLSQWPKIFPTW